MDTYILQGILTSHKKLDDTVCTKLTVKTLYGVCFEIIKVVEEMV